MRIVFDTNVDLDHSRPNRNGKRIAERSRSVFTFRVASATLFFSGIRDCGRKGMADRVSIRTCNTVPRCTSLLTTTVHSVALAARLLIRVLLPASEPFHV